MYRRSEEYMINASREQFCKDVKPVSGSMGTHGGAMVEWEDVVWTIVGACVTLTWVEEKVD